MNRKLKINQIWPRLAKAFVLGPPYVLECVKTLIFSASIDVRLC